MSLFSSYIYGGFEDNTWMLAIGEMYKRVGLNFTSMLGYPFGYVFDLAYCSQPLLWNFYHWINFRINSIMWGNIFILISILLALFWSNKLFYLLLNNKLLSKIMALLSVFNPYMYYQLRNHPDLAQIWVFYLCMWMLTKKYNLALIGIVTGLVFGISNYLGYFTSIVVCVLVTTDFVLNFKSIRVLEYIRKILLFAIPLILTVLIIEAGFISHMFINNNQSLLTQNTKEDFFYFTSRPWYYFLPSIDNPFTGEVTKKFLSANADWWLAANYFKSEHSASFLGWLNLAIFIAGTSYVILSPRISRSKLYIEDPKLLYMYLTLLLIIILISMPPYISLSGFKIYFPSYILLKLFPMFRVLSRLGFISLFSMLTINGIYLGLFIKKAGTKSRVILPLVYALVCLAEFFIPLRFTYVGETPRVFQYLKNETDKNSVIAVYPYNRTNYALFWEKDYIRNFVNPNGIETFDSKGFTDSMKTDIGLSRAKELGVTHLIYFQNADNGLSKNFFDNSKLLSKDRQFSQLHFEKNYANVINVDFKDYTAQIYKFK